MVAWLLESIGIRFAVFSVGQGARGFFPSHAVAFKGDAVGIVDDTVEDGVGDGRLTDHVVPLGDGQLGSDHGRFAPVALFEDFQEIEALLIIERVGAPIVVCGRPLWQALFDTSNDLVGSIVCPAFGAECLSPLALMKSDDQEPHQGYELCAQTTGRVFPGLR